MALHPLQGLALCAGVAMLDEGLRAGLEYLGLDYRTVAYVEREAPAAAQLVALMEAGAIHQAPIWSDLTTFDARPWRGKLDCITAGFPCQPHSVAGKRAGLEDARWIWPDITRIVREAEPSFCGFENVPGLVSTGGLEHVLFDLASLGFDVECGSMQASSVGAAHQREREFILAYRRGTRLANARRLCDHALKQISISGSRKSACAGEVGPSVGFTHSQRSQGRRECRDPQRRQEPSGYAGLASGALFAPPQMTINGPTLSQDGRTSRPRLNPAFACWLMGWPWWWTNPAPISFAPSEMALYRSRLQQHLCNLLGEPALSEVAA
jgi:DNA (cytosine-5)-methyltransferase 1